MKKATTPAELLKRIEELENENAVLRREFSSIFKGHSVKVPPELKSLFDKAQHTVSEYFTDLRMEPTKGTIEINDQRYVLIRASALSKDFLQTVKNLYADRGEEEAMTIGKNFLFDIAHVIGMNDAREFHQRMHLTEPIAKLSAGPLHFAYTGWAFVEILPESNPSPDDDFCLIYHHPYSFEAESWNRSGQRAEVPVCIMNAGYSSGWCEESFGMPLTAVEISCTARGDDKCIFVMSPPHRIREQVERYTAAFHDSFPEKKKYDIPTFFDRKRVEEEMQRSRQLAEESARSKEDFVANISHELRTPLGAILGFTEMLKKTRLSDEQKEYLEAITGSGNSLLSIINDVLDLSKIDAGKLQTEEVNFSLSHLLQSLQLMFEPKAAEKNLEWKVVADPLIPATICGDPLRLTQILVNLIGNAIKFTNQGSVSIESRLSSEKEDEVMIRFIISDTGIGIPAEKLDTIFERFTQADSDTTRRYGGTGLGLAISRQLILLLGGGITVESETHRGAKFIVDLPFRKNSDDFSHEVFEQDILIDRSKTILLVEDNLMNQKLTTLILKNNGLAFHLAENGSEAVELLKKLRVDLILMDLQMPVMDGYKATCVIREELQLRTPIIAMTAHALSSEKEKCFRMGVNGYLPKPFTEQELLRIIAHHTSANESARPKLIDLSFLIKQTRNNKVVIEEMMELFRQQALHETALLKDAVEKGNYQAIYKTAHLLRNAISLVGLTPVIGNDLLLIEKMAHRCENIDEIKSAFLKIEEVCRQAVVELEEMKVPV